MAASVMTSSNVNEADEHSGIARKIMHHPRYNISIHLKNHFQSKVYTSSSPVLGDLVITTRRDTRFDSIQVVLFGSTRTRVNVSTSTQDVTHTFLKMVMPISESTYPVPRVLEAGRTYRIPFNFVVPHMLTDGACRHRSRCEQLHDQHVRPPPTISIWEKDDMAPKTVQVEYAVKGMVMVKPDLGGKTIKIMEVSRAVKVLPACPEEPPLDITPDDRLYTMSQCKPMRKNLLGAKVGWITAEAAQPSAVFLSPDGINASATSAQITLRFDPASPDAPPPRVAGVSTRLTAHTYYSSRPMANLPDLGRSSSQALSAEHLMEYATSLALPPSRLPAEQTPWTTQHLVRARRDSGYSTGGDAGATSCDSEDSCSSSCDDSKRHAPPRRRTFGKFPITTKTNNTTTAPVGRAPLYHTATLRVPVELPTDKKMFVPTFHSCTAARIYTLGVSVTLAAATTTTTHNTTNAAPTKTKTLHLVLPLQIAVGTDPRARLDVDRAPPPSFETAMQEAEGEGREADEHLLPRTMHAPPSSSGSSSDSRLGMGPDEPRASLPPSY